MPKTISRPKLEGFARSSGEPAIVVVAGPREGRVNSARGPAPVRVSKREARHNTSFGNTKNVQHMMQQAKWNKRR